MQLTVSNSLVVVIGLSILNIVADKLKIDFVLHVAHQNERCYNTLALTRSHCHTDLSVPDVVRAGEESADCAWRHGKQQGVAVVLYDCAGANPVGLAGVSQVSGVRHNIVKRVKLVVRALASWSCHA